MQTVQKIFLAIVVWGCVTAVPKLSSAEELLRWDDCVREALAHHPDLVAAQQAVVQADADIKIRRAAGLPQLTGSLGVTASGTEGTRERTLYSYGLSGRQLLFDGAQTAATVEAASRSLSAQEYECLVESSNIRLRLKTAFAALLKAQEMTALTEQIAQRRRENFELVQLRYAAGREHKGAVLTAQADLVQAEFEVSQAQRAIVLVQRELSNELGRKKTTSMTLSGDFAVNEPTDAEPDYESLADNTPFLKALIARKDAAGFTVTAASAEWFPQVYLNGAVGADSREWPPRGDASWSAGLTASWSVFEGGARQWQIAKAQAQLRQTEAVARSGRDSVLYTLEETWNGFQDAVETVTVKNKFLEAAVERAKIAGAQYTSGLITFDDWIIIENNLVSARKAQLDAQENVLVAESYWVQAQGRGLENEKK